MPPPLGTGAIMFSGCPSNWPSQARNTACILRTFSKGIPIWVKISEHFVPCDLEILMDDLENIGHLFYTTLSFVHRFEAVVEFKLELQSGNAQFGSKPAIVLTHMTLKFDGWPWKTIGHLFYASFHHHMWIKTGATFRKRPIRIKIGDFVSCDLEIWRTDDLEKH